MAIGITGPQPELEIKVTYDTSQSAQQLTNSQKKIEAQALKHEQKLKEIAEKGALQQTLAKQKYTSKNEAQEKTHQDRLRRMTEVAKQRMLLQQEAYQQRMLRSQSSWSAKMSKGLGSLVMGMKVFAATYALMFIKNAMSGAFNFVDELRKTSEALNINIERLQVYTQMLSEAGSNAEGVSKIFDKLTVAMDDALAGDKSKRNIFSKAGIGQLDDAGESLEKIIIGIKTGLLDLNDLSAIFGSKMAAQFRKIALATTDYNTVLKSLGKNLISEEQARQVENFNDAISRLSLSIKIGFARAMSSAAGEGTTVLDKWTKAIGDVDWEAVGDGILVVVKAFEALGKNIEGVAKASKTLFTTFSSYQKFVEVSGGMFKASTFIQASKSDDMISAIDDIMQAYSKFLTTASKGQKFFSEIAISITKFWLALGKGETILGKVGKFLVTAVESVGKLGKFLVTILKPLSSVFKLLGKISVYLTLIFVIYDFISALTKGLNLLEAVLYTVLKFVTDIVDGLAWIISLGDWDTGITDWMESWGIWGEAFADNTNKAKENVNKIFHGSTTVPPENNSGWPDINGGEKSWADNLKEQIKEQEALRAETLKHISLLEDYANKYKNNADVMKVVNEQLREQQEILDDLNRNKKITDIQGSGIISNIPGPKPAELASIDFKSQLPKELELITSKFIELKAIMKDRDATRTAIGEWEKLKDVFKDNIEATSIIEGKIAELKQSLEFAPSGFDKAVADFSEWYSEWNVVVAQTAEFFEATFNLQTEALYNQMEVLQEIIRLENERWSAADARMEESGIKNTAYYIKLKKDHEKYIKALEEREYKLKGDAWESDKSSKVAQTIMNTAQAIMAAWSAGPIVGAIMSAIIAATGAVQLQTIQSQKNPYRRASGGWIPGTSYGDSVSTMLTPGEFVINRNAARENAALLENINSGGNPSSTTTNVYVSVDGTIVGQNDWIEQQLIPGINKAVKKGYVLND